MNKIKLRTNINESLQRLSSEIREEKSRKIMIKLQERKEWQRMTSLYTFLPYGQEPLIDPAIQSLLKASRPVSAPRIEEENTMRFYPVKSLKKNELQTHKWGIREPLVQTEASLPSPGEKAVMLVPGCAFSPQLKRLGRGGGFYDRYLSLYRNRFLLIGVCFQEQIVPEIPEEQHDIPMDMVITDQNIYPGKPENGPVYPL